MSKSLPKRVGELFAHVQDLIDTATHTAIKRVDENKGKRHRLLGFFSSIGDAYCGGMMRIADGRTIQVTCARALN